MSATLTTPAFIPGVLTPYGRRARLDLGDYIIEVSRERALAHLTYHHTSRLELQVPQSLLTAIVEAVEHGAEARAQALTEAWLELTRPDAAEMDDDLHA